MMQVQSCKLPGTAPTACTEKARSPHAFPAQKPMQNPQPKSPEIFAATAAESVTRAPRLLLRVAGTPPIQGP